MLAAIPMALLSNHAQKEHARAANGPGWVAARTARYTAEHLVYQTQQRILGSEQMPMMVVDYHLWDAVGHIPRSSEGFARGVRNGDSVVFISHRWWEDQPPITGGLLETNSGKNSFGSLVAELDL